jgi:uncharacterized protein
VNQKVLQGLGNATKIPDQGLQTGVSMKILTVSDYVASQLYPRLNADRIPKIDLILSCGDLPPEYLSYLLAVFGVPLYYVRGNHDIRFDSKPPHGCIDVNARIASFHGLKLLGLAGSRWYNGGPCQFSEAEMGKKIRRLRPTIWWKGGIDIVITHAPPRHIHDAEDRCHRGFQSFRWLIERYSPKYFIHGHIHRHFTDPSERITVVDKTKVINTYGYQILEI